MFALHPRSGFDSLAVIGRSGAKIMKPLLSSRIGIALALLLCLLGGCATTRDVAEPAAAKPASQGRPAAEEGYSANDPLEPLNRAVYVFNDKLDRYVLKPVAKGYRAVLPRPVRKGVSNFFSNLREPAVVVNSALQGKFKNAASDLGRFVTNSTLGVFGIFDVATYFGLEKHAEDLGQTLGVWGIGEGPYLVLPIFGPSNIRDGIGLYGDQQLYPPAHMEEQSTAWKLYVVEAIDTRARLLEAGDILEQAAGQDPYVFVREAYRQRRRSLIHDGAAPAAAPVDPSIFEDDKPSAGSPGSPRPGS
jgi:phospholipid-binding lipoprotein MlaA